jgi:hypothetical protein
MKIRKLAMGLVSACCLLVIGTRTLTPQANAATGTVQVHMIITDQALRDETEMSVIQPENVMVKQGSNILKIDQLIPARDTNAALQLFILIDDTCDTNIGNNLNDLRDFVSTQPATTTIGVAYMSNATIQITQNFTSDHDAVAKAIRLPRGTVSSMDSPFLSLVKLVKGWPKQNVRREVIMVSDGIDRLRRENVQTLPTLSTDADTASRAAQTAGVIVYGIYSPGVGRLGRNYWQANLGQDNVSKIAGETGGEYFALGTQNPVSFKPYLDRLNRIFNNQYYLVFQAYPKAKDGLQRVDISAQKIPDFEIAAADNVFVPAAGKSANSTGN